jgi:hypothetical protein
LYHTATTDNAVQMNYLKADKTSGRTLLTNGIQIKLVKIIVRTFILILFLGGVA